MMRAVAVFIVVCFLVIADLGLDPSQAQPNGSQCNLKNKRIDKLTPLKQETIAWCWAASAQTVMEFLGLSKKDQCYIVDVVRQNHLSDVSMHTCCVRDKNRNGCAEITGWPEWALAEFGFLPKIVNDSAFGWGELTGQLCQDLPIIYAETYRGGSGHSYVIRGFREDPDGQKVVEIYDHDPDLVESPEQRDFTEWPYDTLRLPTSGIDPYRRDAVYYYIDIRPVL